MEEAAPKEEDEPAEVVEEKKRNTLSSILERSPQSGEKTKAFIHNPNINPYEVYNSEGQILM